MYASQSRMLFSRNLLPLISRAPPLCAFRFFSVRDFATRIQPNCCASHHTSTRARPSPPATSGVHHHHHHQLFASSACGEEGPIHGGARCTVPIVVGLDGVPVPDLVRAVMVSHFISHGGALQCERPMLVARLAEVEAVGSCFADPQRAVTFGIRTETVHIGRSLSWFEFSIRTDIATSHHRSPSDYVCVDDTAHPEMLTRLSRAWPGLGGKCVTVRGDQLLPASVARQLRDGGRGGPWAFVSAGSRSPKGLAATLSSKPMYAPRCPIAVTPRWASLPPSAPPLPQLWFAPLFRAVPFGGGETDVSCDGGPLVAYPFASLRAAPVAPVEAPLGLWAAEAAANLDRCEYNSRWVHPFCMAGSYPVSSRGRGVGASVAVCGAAPSAFGLRRLMSNAHFSRSFLAAVLGVADGDALPTSYLCHRRIQFNSYRTEAVGNGLDIVRDTCSVSSGGDGRAPPAAFADAVVCYGDLSDAHQRRLSALLSYRPVLVGRASRLWRIRRHVGALGLSCEESGDTFVPIVGNSELFWLLALAADGSSSNVVWAVSEALQGWGGWAAAVCDTLRRRCDPSEESMTEAVAEAEAHIGPSAEGGVPLAVRWTRQRSCIRHDLPCAAGWAPPRPGSLAARRVATTGTYVSHGGTVYVQLQWG